MLVELLKIIYSPFSKKYKLIFKHISDENYFVTFVDTKYAKNIAMAKEGIVSDSLNAYQLFSNFLNSEKLSLESLNIKQSSSKDFICSLVYSKKSNKKDLPVFIGDGIILALLTYADIKVSKDLFIDKIDYNDLYLEQKEKYQINEYSAKIINKNDNIENKLDLLKSALQECINQENYESAAFLRDRIKNLKK